MKYDIFAPHIVAFSTERGDSGVEPDAPYSGFNINTYCGDSAERVSANRSALCASLGIGDEGLVMPHQIHGVTIANVDNGDSLEGADAVMTAQEGVCIGVSTADCVPVLLHDCRHDVVCAVHSGWRGTVRHITARALEAMGRDYGTDRGDVVAAIGPCIRLDAFEVGDEVYAAFCEAGFDMKPIAVRMKARGDEPCLEKWHINLAAAIGQDLTGVQRVHDCGICTYTSYRRFFSARRLGVNSGRIFNGIMRR